MLVLDDDLCTMHAEENQKNSNMLSRADMKGPVVDFLAFVLCRSVGGLCSTVDMKKKSKL